jgi:hypothetical protein
MNQDQSCKPKVNRLGSRHPRLGLFGGCVSLTAIALLTGAGHQQPSRNIDEPYPRAGTNRLPDSAAQMHMGDKDAKQQSLDAANTAEVDKTNKDMLSLNVIRKADENEKLALTVKEKMKLTIGGS